MVIMMIIMMIIMTWLAADIIPRSVDLAVAGMATGQDHRIPSYSIVFLLSTGQDPG